MTDDSELSFLLRYRECGEHVHVDVFCGPRGGTRANTGHLVFRRDEWVLVRREVAERLGWEVRLWAL